MDSKRSLRSEPSIHRPLKDKNQMECFTHLDWFQGTGNKDYRPFLPWHFESCHGWGNYPKAWTTDFGLKVGMNPNSERQGWHLVARGGEMEAIRAQGIDSLLWLNIIMPHLRKVSRMDVACDVPIEIDWSIFAEDSKLFDSRLKVDTEILGRARKGHTVYFGHPTSEVRIRVYDKAAKLKLLSLALTRVELQTRDKRATQLAKDMRFLGDVAMVGRRAIADRLTVHQEWWKAVTEGTENAEITPIGRTDGNYWQYLQQVLKSIENHVKAGNNIEEIEAFKRHFDTLLRGENVLRAMRGTRTIGTSEKDES